MSALRQRVVAALGNCFGTPLRHLSAFEILAEERRRLETLKQLVNVECRLPVVESDHDSNRDHRRRERIHEASAKSIFRQRPPESVNDGIERLPGLPDFFYAKRENLWVL